MSPVKPDPSPLNAALREIWLRHLPLNRERLQALADVNEALKDERLTPQLRVRGEQEAHKLAGAAGSFGYDSITDLARELENMLREGETVGASAFHRTLTKLAQAFEKTLT